MEQILHYISTFVGEVGYPVAVSAILFWLVYKENENHKAEVGKLAKSLENNTLVMQENTRLIGELIRRFDEIH